MRRQRPRRVWPADWRRRSKAKSQSRLDDRLWPGQTPLSLCSVKRATPGPPLVSRPHQGPARVRDIHRASAPPPSVPKPHSTRSGVVAKHIDAHPSRPARQPSASATLPVLVTQNQTLGAPYPQPHFCPEQCPPLPLALTSPASDPALQLCSVKPSLPVPSLTGSEPAGRGQRRQGQLLPVVRPASGTPSPPLSVWSSPACLSSHIPHSVRFNESSQPSGVHL